MKQNQRLFLSADWALNLLPFAALVDEHGEYLGHRFEITYLTSGRDLLRVPAESRARGGAVVLANPNYGRIKNEIPATDNGLQA